MGEKVTDDFGAQLARVQGDLKAFDRRLVKVEKYCEEDSPEFHRDMNAFVSSYKAVEAEREKVASLRHQENSDRLDEIKSRSDRWNLVIAAFGLICAICMLYLAVKSVNHAQIDPAKLFHSEVPQVAQSQSAHIPIL